MMDSVVGDIWNKALSARVASLILLLWDYLLTLDDERTMFWTKPRNLSTYVFYWNRYVCVAVTVFGSYIATAHDLTNDVCLDWFKTEAWMSVSSFFSVQVILQLRIYAIYNKSRSIAVFIVTGFVLEVTAVVVILGLASSEVDVVLQTATPTLSWCRPTYIPSWIPYFGLTILLYEAGLCSLALFKSGERFREVRSCCLTPTSLIDILLRDCNLYYFGIITIYTVNIGFWFTNLVSTSSNLKLTHLIFFYRPYI